MRGPSRFRFLNDERTLDLSGWDDPGTAKLWRYNLHYFDDLNAADSDARSHWHEALLERWIGENTPGQGTGWEPYPTSLRIVNWIKWALSGHSLSPPAIASLAVQARWLTRRLEYHLLGNHLLANAKGLVFAGAFFQGRDAERWLDQGIALYARELPEQILTDGGHFERAAMYHAIILEDLLDVINLAQAFPDSGLSGLAVAMRATVQRMRAWLCVMTHPDGGPAFFNDTAFGIAPQRCDLEAYVRTLGLGEAEGEGGGPITYLEASGYVRLATPEMVAILDVAPVGPDYLPGHAHADTLSFELSLNGQRVLVNSGTSVYAAGPERSNQRATAAHNTVEVDGANSSEVWGAFRVARRARPFDVETSAAGERIRVSAAHDGYRRLAGRVVHRRTWSLDGHSLLVEDRLSGRFNEARAFLHLHPAASVSVTGNACRISSPGGTLTCAIEGADVSEAASTWNPEFGVTRESRVIIARFTGNRCLTKLEW